MRLRKDRTYYFLWFLWHNLLSLSPSLQSPCGAFHAGSNVLSYTITFQAFGNASAGEMSTGVSLPTLLWTKLHKFDNQTLMVLKSKSLHSFPIPFPTNRDVSWELEKWRRFLWETVDRAWGFYVLMYVHKWSKFNVSRKRRRKRRADGRGQLLLSHRIHCCYTHC